MIELTNKAKLPKRRKQRPECPAPVRAAMDEYSKRYHAVFRMKPAMQYDREFGFVRINGGDGVGLKRLKQLTQQLRERVRLQA